MLTKFVENVLLERQAIEVKFITFHLYFTFMAYYLSYFQEAAFRKVVQTTMVRDRQHGPVIELNRIQVSFVEILIRLVSVCKDLLS